MTDDDATPTAFDGLALPDERRAPRPSFARDLRRRVVDALDLDEPPPPTIDLPARRTRSSAMTPTVAVPYLTASDAAAAIDWYVAAFDAVEEFRVVDDAGRIGHAQFLVGEARFMLSDEYVDMGVVSPTTLGGTGTAIHLTVPDIDARFARAVAAGATSLGEPEDQPHGARHGTIVDPFGHRWMLSQDLEAFDVDEYAARSAGSEWSVVAATGPAPAPATTGGGIWAVATYADEPAARSPNTDSRDRSAAPGPGLDRRPEARRSFDHGPALGRHLRRARRGARCAGR